MECLSLPLTIGRVCFADSMGNDKWRRMEWWERWKRWEWLERWTVRTGMVWNGGINLE
jgi:hypothetical protein